ncbi:MAG TPA: DEAD/DEAH box helicase [Acidimicrobiales bacterium]|nr:DEAD/DEAH box helicase [Acidimicrobiales bacterium]
MNRNDWEASLSFRIDRFQRLALDALDDGRSVLVAAPTGAGKTLVADYAIDAAAGQGLRSFYTTPIKALSNQKFRDLGDRLGPERVGLLTGDNSINGDGQVVVMTTEVLRNMIYAGRTDLDDLGVVVLDEVHYLQDSYRGPVWEEVILQLPPHVVLVCLSATVSNASELGEWLETVRGPTSVVVEERRPVELDHLYLVGDRSATEPHLVPVLVDGEPNPEGARFDVDRSTGDRDRRRTGRHADGRKGGRPRRRFETPDRLEVLDVLADRELLPAIVFVFSRAGCDDAMNRCLDAGVRLTDSAEQRRIREIVDAHVDDLGNADLHVLDFARWRAGLEAGVAAHHAGMVPPFKEAVEACFIEGLVRLVFATETLALGVNMPARSVVIERMTKFNGERREFLTPGDYTQLTGRAGRRGIDDRGAAVVLWAPQVAFERIAALAGSRSFHLASAFRPTYNMAINLVRRVDPAGARDVLGRSFAQFQADRDVVRSEQRVRRKRSQLADLESSLDDRIAIERARDSRRDHEERRRAARWQVEATLDRQRPGSVIGGPSGQPLLILSVAHRKGGLKVRAIDAERIVTLVGVDDFVEIPEVLGHVELRPDFAPKNADHRREASAQLADADLRTSPTDHEPPALLEVSDVDLRKLRRVERLEREVRQSERRLASTSGSLSRQLDRVLQLLDGWGYVDGWALTERGDILSRVYHEADLLVAEAVGSGTLDGLDAAELAAVVSTFVYEHRRPGPPPAPRWPTLAVESAVHQIGRIASDLNDEERNLDLPETRQIDAGFAHLAYLWASGRPLGEVIEHEELSGGDFVRNVRQVVDLLRQLGHVAPSTATGAVARAAARSLDRGVVSASAALGDEA